MARDVFEQSAAARDVFTRADAALREPLSKLIFEGPEEELTLTENAQPAIVTVSIAILAALQERLPSFASPAYAAGHSLGEYSALVASGAMALEDAVRVVRARGKAMQAAVPTDAGAMAAFIGLTPEQVEAFCREAACGEVIAPANFNAPGQIVIAGARGAVMRASELVEARGGKAIPLKVSAPFHCMLMKPAGAALERALASVTMAPLAFPIVSNVEAQPNQDAARVSTLLVDQVHSPVRWEESMRELRKLGVTRAFEIGPGKVLSGLAKRIDKEMRCVSIFDMDSIERACGAVF